MEACVTRSLPQIRSTHPDHPRTPVSVDERIAAHVGGGTDVVPSGPRGLWGALTRRSGTEPGAPDAPGQERRERSGPTRW